MAINEHKLEKLGREQETLSRIVAFNGTNWREIKIDETTRILEIITDEHHEVHAGSHYFIKDFTDLGNGATQDILIVTPDETAWAHLVLAVTHELEASVQFYEDTVVSANGTEQTIFNSNRNSSNTAGCKIYEGPTVTTVGTLLEQDQKGSAKKFGGAGRSADEIILKQNTNYLLRTTNQTASDNLVNWELVFYEHTNLDS